MPPGRKNPKPGSPTPSVYSTNISPILTSWSTESGAARDRVRRVSQKGAELSRGFTVPVWHWPIVRQPLIVGVQKRDQISLGFGNASVSGGSRPPVRLSYHSEARVGYGATTRSAPSVDRIAPQWNPAHAGCRDPCCTTERRRTPAASFSFPEGPLGRWVDSVPRRPPKAPAGTHPVRTAPQQQRRHSSPM